MLSIKAARGALCAFAAACWPVQAAAQNRADDNAITQAEDAFGFSVGRETLGIYNAEDTRGFSPVAAGNLRIDGLFFQPAFELQGMLVEATAIKVGLSAQGYPFTAPSGIFDQTLRRPGSTPSASVVASFDSYGSKALEVTGALPIAGNLSLGYGLTGGTVEYYDGTDNWNHSQSLTLLWRPSADVEIMPFWGLTNGYDDDAGPNYIPAGAFLPKVARLREYEGPDWSVYRYTGTNHGVLGAARLGPRTTFRLGAFRSVEHLKTGFYNLLVDEQPDGTGTRITIADPPTKNVSLSGEARLTHNIAEGPRLHSLHASMRRRDSRRQFGGGDEIDHGPGRVGEKVEVPKPEFAFGELSRDRVRQTTLGLAYRGQWKERGEVSVGVSRARFSKLTRIPDEPEVLVTSRPWLYDATAALNLSSRLTTYAGYARGLEESGVAPANAANRNAPLEVIVTEQKDAGFRFALNDGLKLVAGVFDLSKPYFGFDAGDVYRKLGATRSRGLEFSLSGQLTPRLDLLAGGVILRPRVTSDAGVSGLIGSKPVGVPSHLLNLNMNWRTPWLKGLQLDLGMLHRGRVPARTDNLLFVPSRFRLDLGARYGFKLGKKDATFRLQMVDVFDKGTLVVVGPGLFGSSPARYVQGFLAVDF